MACRYHHPWGLRSACDKHQCSPPPPEGRRRQMARECSVGVAGSRIMASGSMHERMLHPDHSWLAAQLQKPILVCSAVARGWPSEELHRHRLVRHLPGVGALCRRVLRPGDRWMRRKLMGTDTLEHVASRAVTTLEASTARPTFGSSQVDGHGHAEHVASRAVATLEVVDGAAHVRIQRPIRVVAGRAHDRVCSLSRSTNDRCQIPAASRSMWADRPVVAEGRSR